MWKCFILFDIPNCLGFDFYKFCLKAINLKQLVQNRQISIINNRTDLLSNLQYGIMSQNIIEIRISRIFFLSCYLPILYKKYAK